MTDITALHNKRIDPVRACILEGHNRSDSQHISVHKRDCLYSCPCREGLHCLIYQCGDFIRTYMGILIGQSRHHIENTRRISLYIKMVCQQGGILVITGVICIKAMNIEQFQPVSARGLSNLECLTHHRTILAAGACKTHRQRCLEELLAPVHIRFNGKILPDSNPGLSIQVLQCQCSITPSISCILINIQDDIRSLQCRPADTVLQQSRIRIKFHRAYFQPIRVSLSRKRDIVLNRYAYLSRTITDRAVFLRKDYPLLSGLNHKHPPRSTVIKQDVKRRNPLGNIAICIQCQNTYLYILSGEPVIRRHLNP